MLPQLLQLLLSGAVASLKHTSQSTSSSSTSLLSPSATAAAAAAAVNTGPLQRAAPQHQRETIADEWAKCSLKEFWLQRVRSVRKHCVYWWHDEIVRLRIHWRQNGLRFGRFCRLDWRQNHCIATESKSILSPV